MARRLRQGVCNVEAVDGPRPDGYVDDMTLTTAIARAVRTVAASEGGRVVDSKFGGVGVCDPISR